MEALVFLFGIPCLIFLFFKEENGDSAGKAAFITIGIIAGFLGFCLFVEVVGEEAFGTLVLIVMVLLLPILLYGVCAGIKEDIHNATKDEHIPEEVLPDSIILSAQKAPVSPDNEYETAMNQQLVEAFRRRRFDLYDEYLTAEEALAYAHQVQDARKGLCTVKEIPSRNSTP